MDSDLQDKLASIERLAIPEEDRLLILSSLVELEIVLSELREKERQLLEHQAELEERVRERTRALEKANRELRRLASRDPLTGLRNRRMFFEYLRDLRNQAERGGFDRLVLLLFIDINHFKKINDRYGHRTGDELLRQAGERFRAALRKSDHVFRYGGDEFAVLLTHVSHRRDGEIVCRKLLAGLEAPFVVQGNPVTAAASIGISVFPEDTEDVETLIRLADQAMYAAKRDGAGFAYALETGAKRPGGNPPA